MSTNLSPPSSPLDYEPSTGAVDAAIAGSEPVTGLGDRASRGFAWYISQTIAVKVIHFVGQVVLAWLLESSDFGFVGLAYTVATIGGIIQAAGVREFVVQKGHEFDRWASSAFWLSLCLGITSSLVMLALAPVAARFYGEPHLIGLIAVLAVDTCCRSLAAVPEARLQIGLSFRSLSQVGVVTALLATTASIVFASLGFGPYSFVLPLPLSNLLRAAILWRAAGFRPSLRPQVALWRHMALDNGILMLCAFLIAVTWQGDYIILGRLYDPEVVGVYFWAFTLSNQALQLLSVNLGSVLFPSLVKLASDPPRQTRAFVRAAKAMLLIATPLTLMQTAGADPAVRILFDSKWYGGIPAVQLLSLGWVILVVFQPVISLIKAQGRFRWLLVYTLTAAALFITAVYAGARYGETTGAAAGVMIYAWVSGPLGVFLAIRHGGGRWRDVREVYLRPIGAGLLSFGIASGLAAMIPEIPLQNWLKLAVICAVGLGLYLPLVRWAMPDAWDEIESRLSPLVSGIKRRLRLKFRLSNADSMR